MSASRPVIDVEIVSDDETVPSIDEITDWVRRALEAVPEPPQDAELAVRVVDAQEMQSLNREHRQKDVPTNVLSFPIGEIQGLPAAAGNFLGDIVVCASVVRREAAEQGKHLNDHWAHMLVHGTLHLLGYDHQVDSEAATMEALEQQVLARHGVANPYRASS
ncbi:MAG: rRNA maturation RNase YbeY [Woeseiaceae bacterium]